MKSLRKVRGFPRFLYVAVVVGLVSLVSLTFLGSATVGASSTKATFPDYVASTTSNDEPSPSVVTVTGHDFDYVYRINGVQQTIRGVGYNPIYRHLSPEVRAQRYDRDFWLMREAGINTISGWDQDKGYVQDKFDELLLNKAEDWGIGVIMPYYLSPAADYTNLAYKQQVSEDVANWVRHFKDYPAIRMWGLGNEVLFVMPPNGYSEQQRAFAEFLVELADMVHEIDPNHPVIYRESEDVYIPILRDAIAKDGVQRPWLVYGMNVYTFRINEILANWQNNGLDIPIVVSEFAPVGLQAEQRADGYVEMWRVLRSYPSQVLGGLAYVWTTEGPEPVDRDFGLLDANDVAVDDSFNELADEFRQTEAADNLNQPVASQ